MTRLAWLDARTPRERVLLGLGGIALLVWVLTALVWQPLVRQRDAALDRIDGLERGIAVLAMPVSDATAQVVPLDTRPVPANLTEAAATHRMGIRRLEPNGSGAALVLEEAAFDQVILWLEALERDHGLRVTDIEMQRRPAPGIVATTLSVTR